jgi:REP element-mobilizing transposase RayT
MPRGPRLDAPGVLHHVMVRGLERRAIFRDHRDRRDFVQRLAALTQARAWSVYAWALLPNHLHLLVRTAQRPLPRTLGALLGGYVGAFNRRHHRVGHLFQNRYKSIVVEDDPYLLELTRYIHLNPLRAGLVRDLAALDRYRWTGHSTLLGRVRRPWQNVEEVLGQFHRTAGEARRRYRQFVAEGLRRGRRPDLQGGGLRRSAGGWAGLAALRRGRERWAADERVLGSGPFVERLLAEVAVAQARPARAGRAVPRLLARLARAFGVPPASLTTGARQRPVVLARAAVAAVAVEGLGLPGAAVARALGVTPMAIWRGVPRGLAALRARGLDPRRLARAAMK